MAMKSVAQIQSESGIAIPGTVGGRHAAESGASNPEQIPVIYPATTEQVCILLEDSPAEVDAAVAAAREAFEKGPWPRFSVPERFLHRDYLPAPPWAVMPL